MSGLDRQGVPSDGREPTRVETTRSPSNGARHATSTSRAFAVDVQRRDDVVIVHPRGELDLATAETLRNALDHIERAGRMVLDLRGLSFIDSTGLHLLVDLDQRAQRDGFELRLVAPAPPADRTIQLCGLDQTLPFVAPVAAVDSRPYEHSGQGAAPAGARQSSGSST